MNEQLCGANGRSSELVFSAPKAVPSPRDAIAGYLALGLDRLLQWQERSRQRIQLLSLSDAALKDVGLTRADIEAESQKPFWRA